MRLNQVALLLSLILFSSSSFANLDLVTWRGVFYGAIPTKKGISQEYCLEHTPGIAIHTTKDSLAHSVRTDKGIILDHITLTVDKIDNVYLLHGDLYAIANNKNQHWEDHIYYYHYKLSEAGTTKGTWSSDKCKGKYLGIAIKNDNVRNSLA